MAAQHVENPGGSADGADGNPNKDVVKAAAAAAKPVPLSRSPIPVSRSLRCIACVGFAIAFLVACLGFASLIRFDNSDAWLAVAILGLASGSALMSLFIVLYDTSYEV